MKLLKLRLNNFKGIKSFELDAGGKNVNIYGDNATGKTTLIDSFLWILFDKDSQNRKDFQIKTLRPDGKAERGLEHAVEAMLELADGQQLTLKKVFSEKWTKKRGSPIAEFSGHTIDHFINGVPVKKGEYDAKIAEIADEQIFRLLTDPRYFNEVLHWTDRRKLLMEVCGDVSDTEVIASNAKLSELSEILGNRTIEQHRKVVQARRTEINKELQKIPVRIDEVKRGLPNIDDITNPDELPNDIAKLREQLRAKQEELAQAKAGGQVAEKTKELRMIEAQMMDLKNQYRQMLDKKVANKRRELSILQLDIDKKSNEIRSLESTIQFVDNEIRSMEEKLEALRKSWYEENAKTFEFEQDEVCPTCGQSLPLEKIEEAREKAYANFNKAKAEKLESINAEGKRLAAMMKSEREEHLASVREHLEKNKAALAEHEQREVALTAEINSILESTEPIESNPGYTNLSELHQSLQEEIQELQKDSTLAIKAIQKEIDSITSDIVALEQAQARLEAREKGIKRIDELKAEERKLAEEFEELERQLYLTEEFIRAKVRLLEERINSKFKIARFKLFDIQINGAVVECCETTFNGVPFSNLNNGARLNVGLDIINTLAEHFGFAPVVFIDNAESVTDILPTNGQQIRLIVSEKDKKLRVEVL